MVIFLKIAGEFDDVAPKIFQAIGFAGYSKGDSANSLNGIYGVVKCFGAKIKLEENSYDYEDDYRYSVFINEDVLSPITTTQENIDHLRLIVVELLNKNLGVEIAIEKDGHLSIYK